MIGVLGFLSMDDEKCKGLWEQVEDALISFEIDV